MKHDRTIKEALADAMYGTNFQDLSNEQRHNVSQTESSMDHRALHELANRYKLQQKKEQLGVDLNAEVPNPREIEAEQDINAPMTREEAKTWHQIEVNNTLAALGVDRAIAVAHDDSLTDNRLTTVNVSKGCGGHAEAGNQWKGSRNVKDHSISHWGGADSEGGVGSHQEFFNQVMSRPEKNEGFVEEGEREEDSKMAERKKHVKGHQKSETRNAAATSRAHNVNTR